MLTIALSLALIIQDTTLLEVSGKDAGLRIIRSTGDLHSEFYIVGEGGERRIVAVSTSHPALGLVQPAFQSFRGLGLSEVKRLGNSVELKGAGYSLNVSVPESGHVFNITATAQVAQGQTDAMVGFALFPSLEKAVATRSFAPAGDGSELVTYDRFMTPAVAVASTSAGIAILPDVSKLALGVSAPPMLHLDSRGRAVGTPIVGFGYAPYDRDTDWQAVTTGRPLYFKGELSWSFGFVISDEDVFDLAAKQMWSRSGRDRARSPYPQLVPFRYYTKPTYRLGNSPSDSHLPQDSQSLWWTSEIGGVAVRAPFGTDGQGKIDIDHNLARFAWGLKWWGRRLIQGSWEKNAGEVINLVLSAPDVGEDMPVSIDLITKSWRMEPTDLSAVAQTGRWMLNFAEEFEEFDRRDELIAKSVHIAEVILKEHPTGLGTLFLMEMEKSGAIDDRPLKDSINSYLLQWTNDLRELARLFDRQGATATAESVATALALVESGDSQSVDAGKALLTRIFLNQALFTPPMYGGTPIFGAHVTDKVLRQEQSVYSADLLRATISLGDRSLVERAIASLRSPLALFSSNTNILLGMRFPTGHSIGRSYPWYGSNGRDDRGLWQGPAEGAGQMLASFAETLDTFGSLYTHESGWTIGIDGIYASDPNHVYNGFSRNSRPFAAQFIYVHVNGATGTRTEGSDPPLYPAISNVQLGLHEDEVYVVATPGFVATDATTSLSGTFSFGDGSSADAEFLPTGFGVKSSASLLAQGPVSFYGRWKDFDLDFPARRLLASPPNPDWSYGWIRKDGLMDIVRSSVTMNGKTVVSTADDGRGQSEQALTGTIRSHPFLLTNTGLSFTMHGAIDEGVYVELVDAVSGFQFLSAKKTSNESEEIHWEVRPHRGTSVIFRLVDKSEASSITVESLRWTGLEP